jgi:hypothetical protein
MKIICIGDIHGRDTWKKIVEKEPYDIVVFLGDYVSTHEHITEEQQITNLEEILTFKEENPDKVILLRGNHDLQHLGYAWAECSGLCKNVLKHMSDKKVKRRFLKDTQWIYIYNDIIFSHAGISKTWLKKANCSIDKLNSLPPSPLFAFSPGSDNIFDNTGNSIYQPLTWIRPMVLIEDAIDKYTQVVGHTPRAKITMSVISKYPIWFCDTMPYEYLVIEDGDFKIKYVNKPVIVLLNRYMQSVYLELIEDNKWVLKGSKLALYYIGVSYDDNGILAVDPSGGPYLAVGERVPNTTKKIISIKEDASGYIFTLEDESKTN